jgi:hypothetical protein
VTLRNYQPVAWVLYQRVIDQSKADIFIKPGIMMMIIAFCLLSLNLGVGVFNTGRTSDQRKR